MRRVKQGAVFGAVLAALVAATPAGAATPPELQALGWVQGESQVSEQGIRCEVPTIDSGFTDGSFTMGLWNTFGQPTVSFPNSNLSFANPCGGWISVQNNLLERGITLDRIELRYKIAGAKRFRQFVPTRNGFPIACRPFRKEVRFASARLNAVNSSVNTPGEAPNVAFLQPVPLVTPQLIHCLRAQYAPLPSDVFVSFPLVIRGTAVGILDTGETVRSNTINYTLTLHHLCGNGRLDFGEFCDPAAPNVCLESCTGGFCEFTGAPCTSALDCAGVCLPGNDPQECTCAF